ncbi:DUF3990 domain-containing protein [Fredinandcohnia salidurans]|uniref:DUF3990 domain-containing protein n=1 Tax=Fredinandcohnia salidurans TaxID=2595041 RepID=A0ABW4MPK0_9BACI
MYDYLDRFKLCYHGTTSNHAHHIVDAGIDVNKGYKAVDFGQGFYTTSSFEQAKKHAQKLWKDAKNNSISPAVVRLELDVINLKKSIKNHQLSSGIFEVDNDDFYYFVYNCRKEGLNDDVYHDHDIVAGPLADGKPNTSVKRLSRGYYEWEDFIRDLKPHGPNMDQLSFHTVRSLQYIIKKEVREL